MKATVLGFAAGCAMACSGALSLIHPWGNVRADVEASGEFLAGSNAPPEVRQLLESKCGNCHSYQTRWPLYSRLAPGSWLMEHDVANGRAHMNLSQWQQYEDESRMALLSQISVEIRTGAMPLKQYLWLHPSARLSESEQQMIYAWSREERRRLRATHPEIEK